MTPWKALNTEGKVAEVRNAHKFCTGTARTIATYLSIKFEAEISRSAVIGLYHRNVDAFRDLPLTGDHGPGPTNGRDANGHFSKPAPKPKAKPKLKIVQPPRMKPVKAEKPAEVSIPRPMPMLKKIMDEAWNGRHECRWPVDGEKEHTRFCCAPASAESSYCDYHRLVARGRGTESERKVAPMPVKRVA